MLTFTVVQRKIGTHTGGFYRTLEAGSIIEAQRVATEYFGVSNPRLSLHLYRDAFDAPVCSYCHALDEWISLPSFDG